MTKTNRTKRSLLMSGLALLLCISMLIGSTFAWFTDSVTSAGNIIKSGTLDISMKWADGTEAVPAADSADWNDASKGAIFNYDKWEPGYTEARHIAVKNEGTLALKYQLTIVPTGEVSKLADVIDVYYIKTATQLAERADLSAYTPVGTLAQLINNEIAAVDVMPNGRLEAQEGFIATLVLKMREEAGNDYQGKSIGTDFAVKLIATQDTVELDSFDNQYDKDAEYPIVESGVLESTATEALVLTAGNVTIKVPAGAPSGAYGLSLTKFDVAEDAEGTDVAADFSLTHDGQKVDPNAATYDVIIKVDPMSVIKSVKHIDKEITNYTYDAFTGEVSFQTTSFSPFYVEYDVFGYDVAVDESQTQIKGGHFVGVNPATVDASLLAADSEYIAVDFVLDGVKHYLVSPRATTVILGDADDGGSAPTFENSNCADKVKMINNNRLYAEISALQNNDHSTVYILPGTYNEGTTINVYSSMDIIGLGAKDSVKIIKTSSSSSNRHLFNCNGTKADYIEVMLSNLYLDATAKTTNSSDNAAVQSIRKSKVKCYDLTIVKGTGWDAVAFYVNGNNAVDGVKYPAYLYAENCALNTTASYGIVTTKGNYKFYHSGLTYGGKAYTNNSGSIKNIVMEPGDWEW
jgi:predicted ribosomally synthesized peptide with SipW-like signal peptide